MMSHVIEVVRINIWSDEKNGKLILSQNYERNNFDQTEQSRSGSNYKSQ